MDVRTCRQARKAPLQVMRCLLAHLPDDWIGAGHPTTMHSLSPFIPPPSLPDDGVGHWDLNQHVRHAGEFVWNLGEREARQCSAEERHISGAVHHEPVLAGGG